MRKIYLVLRLFFEAGLSIRAVARSIKASPSTVGDYIRRAKAAGLGWPLPEGMDERALEAKLFPPPKATSIARPLPDWSTVHQELRRKGVTLALLWHEYKTEQPEGLQYSWFCERYRAWSRHLDVVMRQEHRAGEKLFVDYAGHTVPVVNRETAELREAQVFVAVLGASNYTFAEATWTQSLPDWCASHVRALRFFGGATELVVPDNLRAAITQPHRYEPDANPTYQDLAEHYGMAILPARVRRPRDKSKVEVGVQLVERWILAALRHRVFFSLAELNTAISELLHRLNERPFNKLPGSRRSLFESLDQPALKPLPSDAYLYAEWKKVRVHIDYHVEVDRHYYSVPYTLVGKQLHARFSAATVEVFHRGVRVASHV
jgi:transposase